MGAQQRENVDLLLRTRLCQRDHYSFWSTALGTNIFSVLLVRSSTLSLSSPPASIHSHTENSRGKQRSLESVDQSQNEVTKVFYQLCLRFYYYCTANKNPVLRTKCRGLFLKNQESSRCVRKTDWCRPRQVETGTTTSRHFRKHHLRLPP